MKQTERDPAVVKYEKTIQYVINAWAACRTASYVADEDGNVGTKDELNAAVEAYVSSNPELNVADFGFMYVLLKNKGFPNEIIEDVSHYFERCALLSELNAAYRPRA